MNKLRLNEYKKLYSALQTPWPPVNHLIYGILFWIEEAHLSYRIDKEVDTAIHQYIEMVEEMQKKNKEWEIQELQSEVDGLPVLIATHKSAKEKVD